MERVPVVVVVIVWYVSCPAVSSNTPPPRPLRVLAGDTHVPRVSILAPCILAWDNMAVYY